MAKTLGGGYKTLNSLSTNCLLRVSSDLNFEWGEEEKLLAEINAKVEEIKQIEGLNHYLLLIFVYFLLLTIR